MIKDDIELMFEQADAHCDIDGSVTWHDLIVVKLEALFKEKMLEVIGEDYFLKYQKKFIH